MIAVVPFGIAILASQMVGSIVFAAALLGIGIAVMCWIHYKFVPLIVR